MSTTPARIAANRKNAQKSTGPRTEEGKRRVARNAQTHGLTAQTICLAEESDEALYTLRRHMLEDLKPQGEIQCQLAETMIAARWRLMRLWETETDLYDQAIEAESVEPQAEVPATRRRTRAFQKLAADCSLDKLHRYETRLNRDYDRAFRRLKELQAQEEQDRQRRRKEEAEYLRRPPIQHTDLLSADEYIRLQRKEKAPEQNKPNLPPSAPSESSAPLREQEKITS